MYFMHLFYALQTEYTLSITIIDVHIALIGGVNVILPTELSDSLWFVLLFVDCKSLKEVINSGFQETAFNKKVSYLVAML